MSADLLTLEDEEIKTVTDDDFDCKADIFAEDDERPERETETDADVVVVELALAEKDESAEDVFEDRGDNDKDVSPVLLCDPIDEIEIVAERLASADADVDLILDRVMVNVEIAEFDAMEADCEVDDEADTDADGENVFVKVSSIEMRDVKVETTVVVAVTTEFSVTDGDGESVASELTLGDEDGELKDVTDTCDEREKLELELSDRDTAGEELGLPEESPVEETNGEMLNSDVAEGVCE